MKHLHTSLLSTLLLFCLYVNAKDFTTYKSGPWRYPSTWSAEGTSGIPGENDNVFIQHAISSEGGSCKNLTITSTLHVTYASLMVYGDLLVTGELSSEYPATLWVYGDIVNNGSWKNGVDRLFLVGETDQTLSGDSLFKVGSMNDNNENSVVILASDLNISGWWLFHGSPVKMKTELGAHSILTQNPTIIDGCALQGGTGCSLVSTDGSLQINWSGAISFDPRKTSLDSVTTEGMISIYGNYYPESTSNLVFKDCINNGTLRCAFVSWEPTQYIIFTGSFTNNGMLMNNINGRELHANISGEFINNGSLQNYSLNFQEGVSTFTNNTDTLSVLNITGVNEETMVQFKNGLHFTGNATIKLNGGKIIPIGVTDNHEFNDFRGSYLTTEHTEFHDAILRVPVNNLSKHIGDSVIYNHYYGNTEIHSGFRYYGMLEDSTTNFGTIYDNKTIANGPFYNTPEGSLLGGTYNGKLYQEGSLGVEGQWTTFYFNSDVDFSDKGQILDYNKFVISGETDQEFNFHNHEFAIGMLPSFQLTYDLESTPEFFQWMRYQDSIPYATSNMYQINTYLTMEEWYGEYYCKTSEGNSPVITITGDLHTAITDLQTTQPTVQIYPNPASDILMVEWHDNLVITYTICSLEGKSILTGKLVDKNIPIATLQNGTYILNLTTEDQYIKQKFIVRNLP